MNLVLFSEINPAHVYTIRLHPFQCQCFRCSSAYRQQRAPTTAHTGPLPCLTGPNRVRIRHWSDTEVCTATQPWLLHVCVCVCLTIIHTASTENYTNWLIQIYMKKNREIQVVAYQNTISLATCSLKKKREEKMRKVTDGVLSDFNPACKKEKKFKFLPRLSQVKVYYKRKKNAC